MTVSGQFRVDTRPYSGYTETGLPIGSYIAQAGIAGDASGGSVIINFLFQPSEEQRVSESYNLEQLAIDISDGSSISLLIATQNMDNLAPERNASPQKWALDGAPHQSDAAMPLASLAGLPLWLGSPARVAPSSEAGLRLTFLNVDLRLYAVTIQGYIWGPRSVLAPGGPQRPIGGFLGR